MDIAQILDNLKAERDRIDQAVTALVGNPARKPGRPRLVSGTTRPKRRMSATARKRISQAAKKRWALWRNKKA